MRLLWGIHDISLTERNWFYVKNGFKLDSYWKETKISQNRTPSFKEHIFWWIRPISMNSPGATASKKQFLFIYDLEKVEGCQSVECADDGIIRCREIWVCLTQNLGLKEKKETFVQDIIEIENLFTETLQSITLFLKYMDILITCKPFHHNIWLKLWNIVNRDCWRLGKDESDFRNHVQKNSMTNQNGITSSKFKHYVLPRKHINQCWFVFVILSVFFFC